MSVIEGLLAFCEAASNLVPLFDEFSEVPVFDGERIDAFGFLPYRRTELGFGFAQQVHFARGITHALGFADVAESLRETGDEIAGGRHGESVISKSSAAGSR